LVAPALLVILDIPGTLAQLVILGQQAILGIQDRLVRQHLRARLDIRDTLAQMAHRDLLVPLAILDILVLLGLPDLRVIQVTRGVASTVTGPTGYTGYTGPMGGALAYKFDDTTNANAPADGFFKFNSSDYSLVTTILIEDTNADGVEVATTLNDILVGDIIKFTKETATTTFARYKVSGNVDSGNYHTLTVIFKSYNSTFILNNRIGLFVEHVGQTGYTGYTGPTGYTGYTGPQITGYTGYTGPIGYTGYTGPAIAGSGQTYIASNVTPDRTYDANATTTDELADVLGTLIADLRGLGIVV
jgi:hypothetical protein